MVAAIAPKAKMRKRLEAGLCYLCGQRPGEPKRCGPCVEYQRTYHRDLEAGRKAQGLCPRCGGERVAKMSLCGGCLDYQARAQAKYKAKKKGE